MFALIGLFTTFFLYRVCEPYNCNNLQLAVQGAQQFSIGVKNHVLKVFVLDFNFRIVFKSIHLVYSNS